MKRHECKIEVCVLTKKKEIKKSNAIYSIYSSS